MTTTRTILSLSTTNGWSLHQMDVKNVFLHGDLTKDIYMTPPQRLCFSVVCASSNDPYMVRNKLPKHVWQVSFSSL